MTTPAAAPGATIEWTAAGGGSVAPAVTHPGLTRLRSATAGLERFDGAPSPGTGPWMLVVATGSVFALFLEASTSRGRRQFRFEPGADPRGRRFGYRYQVGLDPEVRSGDRRVVIIDPVTIAAELEPEVVIESIDSLFVRLAGTVAIDVRPIEEPPLPPSRPSGTITRIEATRFLNQATFGASRAGIDELVALGSYGGWIDAQLALTPSLTLPYVRANSNGSNGRFRHEIWWINVMEGADQLRQRVAFAWSQLFVVSDIDYELHNAQYGISGYYDMLATDGFGSFRNLLERVTLHPVMGIYLSMLRNERADPERNVRPDENYAREILQLFTIGLDELTADGRPKLVDGAPVPTYDQSLIEELAKVFTGWNLAGTDRWESSDLTAFDKESPMTPVERYHNRTAKRLIDGTVLAAGGSVRDDLEAALDVIAAHPNVGPFISSFLIRRLVTSNPSPGYVGRVAAVFDDNGRGERGDLAAVVRAVLIDAEARSGHLSEPERFGKFKEPILRLTQLWRAFDARPGSSAGGVYRPYVRAIEQVGTVLGQAVLRSPSVFNFYQSDHRLAPDSELVAPEHQILAEIDVASTNNLLFRQIYTDNSQTAVTGVAAVIDVEAEVALASDPEKLLDHLDELLAAGQLPTDLRRTIVDHLIEAHPVADDRSYLLNRALDAIFCIVASPFHLVQK